MGEVKASSWAAFHRLLGFVRPYLGQAIVIIVMIFGQLASQLGLSWYLGRAVDAGVNGDLAAFGRVMMQLVTMAVMSEIAFYIRYRTAQSVGELATYDIRHDAVERLSQATVAAKEKRHSGDYVSRLSSDMTLIRNMLSIDIVLAFRAAISFAVSLVVMLRMSWKVTLLSMTVGPVISAVASHLGGPMRRHTDAVQQHTAVVNSLAQDAVGGIVIAKAFSLNGHLAMKFGAASGRAAKSGVDLATSQGVMNGALGVLSLLPFFILFGIGGYETVNGRLTLGDLLTILNMMNNLTWPLQSMGQYLAKIKAGLGASSRVFEILDMPVERNHGQELRMDAAGPYALEIQDVCFGYTDEHMVLERLSLRVRRGETVALVGPSGSGKSTLLSLILGLHQPQSGVINLNGQQLSRLSLSSVRRAMAYVPQDPSLLPLSVAENIAYGREGMASGDELREAACKAFADEFISALPQGMNTLLGEQGTGLSGGQRQRISLARAFLRDAPILLLDEATSALDTESEARVQAAIETLRHGRTTVIVAHRLSTIQSVDRIIVIDQGKVVQEGRHDDLITAGGLYASLYREQLPRSATALAAAGR
ncbi:MAG: ABC transporter ATP-binding protein [Bacillota bacterium]